MKKKYFLMGALALMFAVAGGYGVKTSMNNNVQLSDLALANVEALAGDEDPWFGITCSPDNTGPCWAWVIRKTSSCGNHNDYHCARTGNPNDLC